MGARFDTSTAAPMGSPLRLVAAGAALVGVCYGFARFAYGLMAPEMQSDLGMSPALSGLVGAGAYVGYCLAIVVSLVLTPRAGSRAVAVAAGATASAGAAVVAAAPGPGLLAVGVLVAGCSTGVASPALAAAVDARVPAQLRPRAQAVVNAGTGVGVLVSGPVALATTGHWRLGWLLFAAGAALVTLWVARAVPQVRGAGAVGDHSHARHGEQEGGGAPGASAKVLLVLGAGLMGAASVVTWTSGRGLVEAAGMSTTASAVLWTVIGAAGVLGALGGDAVERLGTARAWQVCCLLLAAATAVLALGAGTAVLAFAAAAAFGASYIACTGVVLLRAAQLWPGRVARGVGVAFFAIAAGQALAAPLFGVLAGALGAPAAFLCGAAAAAAAAVLHRG